MPYFGVIRSETKDWLKQTSNNTPLALFACCFDVRLRNLFLIPSLIFYNFSYFLSLHSFSSLKDHTYLLLIYQLIIKILQCKHSGDTNLQVVAGEQFRTVEDRWRVFVPTLRSMPFSSTIIDETLRRTHEMYYLSY